MSARRRLLAPTLSIFAALCGCERGVEPVAAGPPGEVAITSVVAGTASSVFADDVSALHIRGRQDDEALVTSAAGPYVTVGEFNAWLGTYPLRITSDDPATARRQALEQHVTFKLLVEKARASGYEERLGASTDPKSLAMAYIHDQVTNASAISDAAAAEYEAAHPELLAQIGDEVPADVRSMAVKGSMRGEQLWVRVQEWMAEAGIRYEEGG